MTQTIYLPGVEELPPHFPPVDQALDDPDGLLAIGGHLDTATLLSAYSHGIFPWYEDPQPILWWSPSQRAVLPPGAEHVSRSMAKLIRQGTYQVTTDKCFAEVITRCAAPRTRASGTWITSTMRNAYIELHRSGNAHSVECWHGDALVGGLYGVQVGSLFCGESMFSNESNASKFAFIALSRALAATGFKLIDCQLENPHLSSLGVTTVAREKFMQKLAICIKEDINWPESAVFQQCVSPTND